MTFENWEALEDVYEEMLDEELELTKLKKANARKRDLELTLTDEDGEKLRSEEGAPTKKRKKEKEKKTRVSSFFPSCRSSSFQTTRLTHQRVCFAC